MTGTWRDTLFVWSGRLCTLEKNDNKVLQWTGSWVGCNDCPDARTAATPNRQAFAQSDMKFEVSSGDIIHSNNNKSATTEQNLFCYDVTGGPGWDLGEGEDKCRHTDHTHTIGSKVCLFPEEANTNSKTHALVVAKGTNDFGDFISAGYMIDLEGPIPNLTLILARRYLDTNDARAKWSIEELYQNIAHDDPESYTAQSSSSKQLYRLAPWRTRHLHAAKVPPSRRSKGKRK